MTNSYLITVKRDKNFFVILLEGVGTMFSTKKKKKSKNLQDNTISKR